MFAALAIVLFSATCIIFHRFFWGLSFLSTLFSRWLIVPRLILLVALVPWVIVVIAVPGAILIVWPPFILREVVPVVLVIVDLVVEVPSVLVEDLSSIVVAVWTQTQCQLPCVLESVVVTTNLELYVIDCFRSQAWSPEEEVEAANIVEGQPSTVTCLVQPRLKLHGVLGQAHLATVAVEETLQGLCGQVLIHLAEGILQGVREVLNTWRDVFLQQCPSSWITNFINCKSAQCRVPRVKRPIRTGYLQGQGDLPSFAIETSSQ